MRGRWLSKRGFDEPLAGCHYTDVEQHCPDPGVPVERRTPDKLHHQVGKAADQRPAITLARLSFGINSAPITMGNSCTMSP